MEFWKVLGIRPGVTAVMGSGGKTGLLRRLARELPGTVLLCTTTHIRPFAGIPLLTDPTEADLQQAFRAHRCLCLGTPAGDGKLTAPALPMETLVCLADYVLVEADGSRGLPLKAHASHEPVLPANAGQVICVVGASGFGRPVGEAVHRPERFRTLTGAEAADTVAPELAAEVLWREGLCDTVFLNQLDRPEDWPMAERFAGALAGRGLRIAAGSLQAGTIRPL